MAYFNRYTTSLYGRRLGIQRATPTSFGISKSAEFLVGPEAIRGLLSTGESTGTNLAPYGTSVLTTNVSSGVYTIDPPITGIEKRIIFSSTGAGTIYLKSANGETFVSSQGSSQTVLKSTQSAFVGVTLVPISSAQWCVTPSLSSAVIAASTST